MSASQNKKKTLSLGLALIPVISMLLLLIIGYGIMGLRIEPLLLCSAAVAAGIAWWQGYCWEDIINSVVDKLAKAMPVIMILICVGGLIGTWMFSGTIPYMVYWGLKLISPEYILIAAFFLTSVVSVCTGTSWGSAGTVGVALMGVAAGLDVSLAAAAGAVVSGAYFGDKISPLSDSTNFAAIVADTTLFEHIQHLLWTTLPSFLLAAVVYLIAGHSNMLGEVATPQRVTDIIHSLESLYHFNIILILPPVIVLWGAIRKKPVIPLMLSACVLALFLGVIMQGLSIKQGLDAFIDGFDIAMFPQGAEGVVADVPRLLNRGGMFSMMGTILSAGINGSSPPLRPAKRLAYRRCEFLIFSFPILRFASDSCLVWTLMGWTSLTPSPFRRRLPHGMKADSGWIRYWITWRKTAAGLLNRRQSTFPGQELSRRREPIYYGWIVKNWDWMTNS